MSRIGKKPILVPQGVEVKIQDNLVQVKSAKGQLERKFHQNVLVKMQDNSIVVERLSESKLSKSLHGLTRTLISNMVEGVTQGFQKNLDLVGVGYRAQKKGNKLVLSVGHSHPVEIEAPAGIDIEVPAQNKIMVKGMDKELVGAIAANIRAVREPEPYKGKGIKYENEHIRRKAGKTGKK
ncbi:MAG: 50S ribosomal protein L6 [Desulfotomaculum sp.]|nr:50S ribosomal protein L6 [Desulfotomaculum sp.]